MINMDNIEFLKNIIEGTNPYSGEIISQAALWRGIDVKGRLEDILADLKKSHNVALIYSIDNIKFLATIIEGINPVTNLPLEEDDPLRVDYVKESFEEFIFELENDRQINAESSKFDNIDNFSSNERTKPNNLENAITYPSITLQSFCKKIAALLYGAFTYAKIENIVRNFLINDNKIEQRLSNKGRHRYYATTAGENIGITNELITDYYGKKIHRVFYSPNAQKYIIDHLPSLL